MNELTDIKAQIVAQDVEVIQVVAFDNNQAIGKDNQLAWHIPEDLKHFKSLTTGGVVLMGRKTFESLGKPLPNRTNWVITRDPSWQMVGAKVAHDLGQGLLLALEDVKKSEKKRSLFVIGGGEIFAQTLPICDRLEVTRVGLNIDGDAFYPDIPPNFHLIDEQSGVSEKTGACFTFQTYQNISY